MASALLTLDEVAAMYGIPVATLRFWRQKGDGPPSARIGRRVMYRRAAVDSWLDSKFASENGVA